VKVVAVIPCFDEESCIADVVLLMNEVVGISIVADDSSNDDTAEVAEKAGAYVVRRFGKRGFGVNTKAGIDEALIRECDVVVTLDGDGQHNPKEIAAVLEPIERGEADVVVGSRFLGESSTIPRYRRFGIKVITWLYNIGHRQKLSDAQCCFRAYRQEVLRVMSIEEAGFTFSVETLIKARHLGYRMREVPITVLYHKQFSQNSTMNPIKQGVEVAWGTVRVRLKVELLGKIRRLLRKE